MPSSVYMIYLVSYGFGCSGVTPSSILMNYSWNIKELFLETKWDAEDRTQIICVQEKGPGHCTITLDLSMWLIIIFSFDSFSVHEIDINIISILSRRIENSKTDNYFISIYLAYMCETWGLKLGTTQTHTHTYSKRKIQR